MDGFAELIERKRQGSLKVYLGYAAGVGKTYAMLQEGLRLKQQHVDVVIGYLEPHDRPGVAVAVPMPSQTVRPGQRVAVRQVGGRLEITPEQRDHIPRP